MTESYFHWKWKSLKSVSFVNIYRVELKDVKLAGVLKMQHVSKINVKSCFGFPENW